MKQIYSTTLIIFVFLSLILFTFSSRAESTPRVYVDPPITTAQINETAVFINVSITQALNVSAWELKLYYKNNILDAVTASEGPFLKAGGIPTWFWIVELSDDYNSTHGLVWLTCTQLGTVTEGSNGDGTLATITFKPNGGGNSTLHLTRDPDPVDPLVLTDPEGNKITPVNSSDGTIQVVGISDIAITNVTPSKTIVGQNYTMKINVTVENQGDTTQTWNVTAYANTTVIKTKEITLSSGNSTTIAFTWNTTGFAKGNYYTISAYAWPLLGETDTTDNDFPDGMVYVGIPGDVDGNNFVEIKDILAIALAYGSHPGHPKYEPNLDINDDNFIDIKDILTAAINYGQTYP